MMYTIVTIEEDLDFGCEERTEGMPVMAVVSLQDKTGNTVRKKIADQYLYDQNINEGDRVYFDENGSLHKALAEK